jgi:hypothetical protein
MTIIKKPPLKNHPPANKLESYHPVSLNSTTLKIYVENWMRRFAPAFIREWLGIIKEKGLKEFIRQKGWKIVAIFFLYYLIRDSILYIILPYLIINNIIQCQ